MTCILALSGGEKGEKENTLDELVSRKQGNWEYTSWSIGTEMSIWWLGKEQWSGVLNRKDVCIKCVGSVSDK